MSAGEEGVSGNKGKDETIECSSAGVKRSHPLLGLHGKGGPDDKEPQGLTPQVFT